MGESSSLFLFGINYQLSVIAIKYVIAGSSEGKRTGRRSNRLVCILVDDEVASLHSLTQIPLRNGKALYLPFHFHISRF